MTTNRALSIQSKLILAFAAIAITAITLIAWIGYTSARDGLRDTVNSQLRGLQRVKMTLVRTMLISTRNEVLMLAASPAVVRAAVELKPAYLELDKAPVTPEMQAAVRQFYKDEFEPELAKRSAIQVPPDSLLPITPAGLYLHYHYLVNGERPYGQRRVLASPSDHSEYAAVLARIQPMLGPAIERLGLENLVLVDPETPRVFYSYEQSSVVGTNLENGPYASSGLASLVKSLSDTQNVGEYKVSDFEMYRPALGAPKAFIGAPVFDGPKLVAIMVLRFPIEPIAVALSNNRDWEGDGLGKSGEVYLLGPDQTMRSNSRFLIEDPKGFFEQLRRSRLTSHTVDIIEQLNTTILTLPVMHEAARAALNGQTGLMELNDYRGVPVFDAYGPVDLDSLRWGVIAKIDKSEAMAPLRAYVHRVLAVAVGLVIACTLAALLLANMLTRPITLLVRAARAVSRGDLGVSVEVAAADEYRELGETFNNMVANLRESRAQLDHQVSENERMLLSLLPASAAMQIREGHAETRQSFADVTVAYVNLVGFDTLSQELGDDQSMGLLSDIVATCDEAAEHHGVEKVRTIGSSYLAASGLSVERPDHTARMVEFAREVMRIVKRFNLERGTSLGAEIGINAGPVVGGLVGRRKFIYDLWGDTVRLARGIADGRTAIVVTQSVYKRVCEMFTFVPVTGTDARGLGAVDLYALQDDATA